MCFVPGLELGPGEGQRLSVVSSLLTLMEVLSCGSCKYLQSLKPLVVFATHKLGLVYE